MYATLAGIAQWMIPLLLVLVLVAGHKNKVRIYEVFVQGAYEGLRTAFKLVPYILAIFVVIGLFRTSGALCLLQDSLQPLLKWLGIPSDLLTLALLKPLSGSAALAVTADLLYKHGPDTAVGLIASIAQSCSETTFYVLSIYLGSVNIKNGRHTLWMGLISEIAAFWLAVIIGANLTR
jgi:spore maturation protein B